METSVSTLKPPDRYVKVGTINTRFWAQGNLGSEIVLIHGISGSVEDWILNFDAFSEHHRVYALDLIGFGRCDRVESVGSLGELTRFVRDFMDTQDIERAHLVGNSLGGRLALRFAVEFAERTRSLVLANSSGLGRELSPALRLSSIPRIGELLWRPNRRAIELGLRSIVYDPRTITQEMVDRGYEFAKRPGAGGCFFSTLRAGVNIRGQSPEFVRSTLDDVSHIIVRTLIVWGRQDRVLPVSHAQVIADRIPHAKSVIFDQCGHLPQVEQPDKFNRVVLDFLDQQNGES